MLPVKETSPPPAIFKFRNIGPLKEAELELGDLTIIAGRNNTGKTYLAYTLYGFLKLWRQWPEIANVRTLIEDEALHIKARQEFIDIEELARVAIREGSVKKSISRQNFHQQRKMIIRNLAQFFSKGALPGIFSSSKEYFRGASIEIELNEKNMKLKPI